MRSSSLRFRVGYVCLSAALIVSHLLATHHCRCACRSAVADALVESHDSSSTCCGKHGCAERTKAAATVAPCEAFPVDCRDRHDDDRATLPVPGGCDCPPRCPCHVQHGPREPAIANHFADARRAAGEWAACPATTTNAGMGSIRLSDRAAAATVVTSVSRCALLCRFVV